MRRRKLGVTLVAILVTAVSTTGCSASHRPPTAGQLAFKVIDAPEDYQSDATASGQITPQLFSDYGGSGVTSTTGFVAGFKQNYVDSGTLEGISVTLLEFKSAAEASTYLTDTAHQTLSFADATYSPVPSLADATEASGTKTYDGNYVHGIVDTTGVYYFQLVYEDPVSNAVPLEFADWAKIQWALLQPGVKTPSPPKSGGVSTTTGTTPVTT